MQKLLLNAFATVQLFLRACGGGEFQVDDWVRT
jgi:hypothetical protein